MADVKESKFRSLLVPLDGSELAEQALPTALSLARRHAAALHLVCVYVPVAGVYGEHAVPYDEILDRELMERSRDYLNGVVARLEAVAGVRATSALLDGPVADMISRYAATVRADLLIMTTQGRGPLARFWLGSVSDELVRRAGIPVLFVRPQARPVDISCEPSLGRVLIPLDGSPLAERVLEPVFALNTERQGNYTLLRVVMPIAQFNYSSTPAAYTGLSKSLEQLQERDQAESREANVYLDRLAQVWRQRSFGVQTRVISNEHPAAAILDHASKDETDLIALATHGRGGLKRLVLGSVADKVLRGADTAVLVYRPVDDSPPSISVTQVEALGNLRAP